MFTLIKKKRGARVSAVDSGQVDGPPTDSDKQKEESSNDDIQEIHIPPERGSNGTASVINTSGPALGLFQDVAETEDDLAKIQEEEEINTVVKQVLKGKGRALQLVKLMILMSVPLVSLIAISTITLVQIFSQYIDAKHIDTAVQLFLQIDSLITSLQVERGLSATHLTSGGGSLDTIQMLFDQYNKTNRLVSAVQDWPTDFVYDGRTIGSKTEFLELLASLRDVVVRAELDFADSTRRYTAINTELMDIATYSIHIAGNMWPYLVSASAMLRASDAIGIQRALGSSFFLVCTFDNDVYEWFTELEGEIRSLQNMSFIYHPAAEQQWKTSVNGTLEDQLRQLKIQIYSATYAADCTQLSDDQRSNNSKLWFDNMSEYIREWKGLRVNMLAEIHQIIDDEMKAKKKEVVIYTICIGITLVTFVLALVFSVNYAKSMKRLTAKIAEFAEQMTHKSLELSLEKKRTDLLLYQMLPKSVADQLRARKEVLPQYFDQVTIYFSDIVGFTAICAKSSPMDVVAMLNGIYSAFDSSIDRYEVYKVETIGDAYMVVSGLPKPNPHHTREICLMALDLRHCLKDLRIPHLPDESFNLRIGIHSGSCVAGIVGLKMPRYCLFGDTVNTASRMESTGEAHKIHVSHAVKTQLDKETGFIVEERGEIFVKGKGQMKTYWLIGFKDQNRLSPSAN